MPQIDGKQIKDAPNGILTAKINDLAVTEAKIAASAVTTGKINNSAVDEDKLNASVAGGGLTGGGGSVLAVGAAAASAITVNANDIAVATDDSTLEDDGGTPGALRVKALGIDTAQLADDAVENAKIGPLAVDTAELAANAVTAAKADLTDTWDFSSGTLQAATPSAGADAATKAYVDSVASGLVIKEACRLASAAVLPAYTPAGSGVGKTITINATGVLTVDGVTVALNDRVLVKNEGAGSHVDNGIYKCTTAGEVGVAAVLTRATDFDENAEVNDGAFTFIGEGTANNGTGWVLTTNNPITVDTTALSFSQFSGAGTYTGGNGIEITGTSIAADLKSSGGIKFDAAELMIEPADFAGDGLEDDGSDNLRLDLKSGGGLKIDTAEVAVEPNDFAGAGLEDDGSDNLRIAATAAGNGLTGGGGSPLAVSPDAEASIAVDGSGVRAAVPYTGDKGIAPANATTNYSTTGISPTVNPAGGGYVMVTINGLEVEVAADRTKDAYWSIDAGASAQALTAVTTTSVLYWNAAIAKFNLSAAKDKVSLGYTYVV